MYGDNNISDISMTTDKDQTQLREELEDIIGELRMKIRFYLRFLKDNDRINDDDDETDVFVIESNRLFDKMKVMYKKK